MSPTAIYYIWDDRFLEHLAPLGHPEAPERLDAVRRGVSTAQADGVELRPLLAEPVGDEPLLRAHPASHVSAVSTACGHGLDLDADTYTSPRSDVVARLAVGAALELCRAVLAPDGSRVGFAALRPPGHHAERERAMGFCLYSNAAIAALDLLAEGQARRVAIVDWDVHHGNGTQDVLWERADALYVSLHQWPLYPGTGAASELGDGPGRGFTVNVPLPAASGDGEYLLALDRVVLPILRAYDPDLLIISAGYDPYVGDPLASMCVTPAGFGAMARRLAGIGKPTAALLEGGYHPRGLEDGVRSTLRALAGLPDSTAPTAPTRLLARVEEALDHLVELLRPFWPVLA